MGPHSGWLNLHFKKKGEKNEYKYIKKDVLLVLNYKCVHPLSITFLSVVFVWFSVNTEI